MASRRSVNGADDWVPRPGVPGKFFDLEKSCDQQLEGEQMTVSAISHYRGGTIDEVARLAKKLKAI